MHKYLPRKNWCDLVSVYPRSFFKNPGLAATILCFFLCCNDNKIFAEGSKELTANGGYRAFLFSSPLGGSSFPFPTLGTVKVYAKAGETINVGSSVQGFDSGTINFRSPDGKTYTSGNSRAIGVIQSRAQELAGPLPNQGGYTPYTVAVQAGQEGVWEIDFISESAGVDNGYNPIPAEVNDEWEQLPGVFIAAFDISVRDAANSQFLKGRVFTNDFVGELGNFAVGFNAIFNILTSDGYQYTLNNNGQAGNGFTFFVNNKGFRNPDNTPSYKSIDGFDNINVQDPRTIDSPSDITQKIFFNTPSSDLPASAPTPGGHTTWLLKTPSVPSISSIVVKGVEGTVGKAGTSPLGAYFTFNSTVAGTYAITIDVNKNGIFTDPADRKLTGSVIAGANQIYWDGRDGNGANIPAGSLTGFNANLNLAIKAGEVHFPFFDVERNVNGIVLTRLNGTYAPDDTLYWDDTPITPVGTPSNPLKNLSGISSTVNGHKWGSPATSPVDTAGFGNNKSIDTWSYIASAPIAATASIQLREADLSVDSIITVAACAGQPVLYTVNVRNNGPDDVLGAKFRFNFTDAITDVVVTSTALKGASATSGGVVSANAYDAVVDLPDSSVRMFVITGRIAANAAGSINISASVLRPADITDPDATNPDAAAPTDPADECNALPSGAGCNNIVSSVTSFKPAAVAGPDQQVQQNAIVTLSGTGEGTWTQSPGNPVVTVIADPEIPAATATGFSVAGIYHFIYTNSGGCADTTAVTVIINDTTIPNIFTPNGDGKNDVFNIAGLESFPGSQLMIFNRWGNQVYKADNYLNNWDGSGLAEGTYYYVLNRKDDKGIIVPFKGWVFLKRTK